MARQTFTRSQFGSSLNAWLPFLFFSMLSVSLMVVDNRFEISKNIRAQTSVIASPIWWAASRPDAIWHSANEFLQTNQSLREQVQHLKRNQLQANLALQQLSNVQSENMQFRALLQAKRLYAPSAHLVDLVSINSEPGQKRLVINQGSRQQIHLGQVLIDAHGLVGQVSEVFADKAVVITIADADHALPVMVARSGLRAIVFGQGHNRFLVVSNLTPSDDIKLGDVLLSSGVGGRFPPGLPVGVVRRFEQDAALAFISAEIQPFAHLDYGRQLLVIKDYVPVPSPPPSKRLQTISVSPNAERVHAQNTVASPSPVLPVATKKPEKNL